MLGYTICFFVGFLTASIFFFLTQCQVNDRYGERKLMEWSFTLTRGTLITLFFALLAGFSLSLAAYSGLAYAEAFLEWEAADTMAPASEATVDGIYRTSEAIVVNENGHLTQLKSIDCHLSDSGDDGYRLAVYKMEGVMFPGPYTRYKLLVPQGEIEDMEEASDEA